MDSFGYRIDCHKCGFAGTSHMHDATKPETCATQKIKKIRQINAREHIFQQGEDASGIYSLISGLVLITMVDSRGSIYAPRLITPGSAFGYRSSLEDGVHTSSALTLRNSTFCHISQHHARDLMNENKKIRQALVNTSMQDIFTAREELIMFASMNISERLLHFMVTKLLPFCGAVHADGKAVITLPLRRIDLALALGVKAETLSRAIQRLRKDGFAYFDHETVTIPSLRNVEDHLEEELVKAS